MKKPTPLSPAPTLAEQADRHVLYELSVQCAEAEVDFIDDTFRSLRGRRARWLREDFCGTASVSCEWVRRRKTNRAIGVDLDPAVLEWGATQNVVQLDAEARDRVTLLNQDVRLVDTRPQDLILAMNFSYWLLMDRQALKQYFDGVRSSLKNDGIFFLDAYGGYDSFRVITEERTIDGPDGSFTYVWEQEAYDPISGRLRCNIHFAFEDGSRLDRAFSYDWRLWTLPEIRELLKEAGFSRITVYWQGWDENGEPDGNFEPAEAGEAEAGWICYLTAEK